MTGSSSLGASTTFVHVAAPSSGAEVEAPSATNAEMTASTADVMSTLFSPTALCMPTTLTVPAGVEGITRDSNSKKRRRLLLDVDDDDDIADGVVMIKKPKRPLSAYNLFFRHQRTKSIQVARKQDVDKASATGFDESRKGAVFQNLAKHVGRMWRDLPPNEKAPFEERAAEEKRRYDEKMARWKSLRGRMGLVRAVTASSSSLSQLPFYPHSSTTTMEMTWPYASTCNATFATITATPSSQASPSAVGPLLPCSFLPHASLGTAQEAVSNLSISGGTPAGGPMWCPVIAQEGPFPSKTKTTPAVVDAGNNASTLTEDSPVIGSSSGIPDDTAQGNRPWECTPLPFLPSSSSPSFALGKMSFGTLSAIEGGEIASIDAENTFWSDPDIKSLLQTLGDHCFEADGLGQQHGR